MRKDYISRTVCILSGNTARRAFNNPEIFSEITGVPVDLIKDFDDLLSAICSGEELIPEDYQAKADSWLDRFFANDDINWNIFSPTVHMVGEKFGGKAQMWLKSVQKILLKFPHFRSLYMELTLLEHCHLLQALEVKKELSMVIK